MLAKSRPSNRLAIRVLFAALILLVFPESPRVESFDVSNLRTHSLVAANLGGRQFDDVLGTRAFGSGASSTGAGADNGIA